MTLPTAPTLPPRERLPQPLTTAAALGLLVPPPVRKLLRWRVALDCDYRQTRCLCVQVGGDSPYRLLMVYGCDDGRVGLELWTLAGRGGVRTTAAVTVVAAAVGQTLQQWSRDYLST